MEENMKEFLGALAVHKENCNNSYQAYLNRINSNGDIEGSNQYLVKCLYVESIKYQFWTLLISEAGFYAWADGEVRNEAYNLVQYAALLLGLGLENSRALEFSNITISERRAMLRDVVKHLYTKFHQISDADMEIIRAYCLGVGVPIRV